MWSKKLWRWFVYFWFQQQQKQSKFGYIHHEDCCEEKKVEQAWDVKKKMINKVTDDAAKTDHVV